MSVNIKVTGGLNIEWGQIDPKVTGGLRSISTQGTVLHNIVFVHIYICLFSLFIESAIKCPRLFVGTCSLSVVSLSVAIHRLVSHSLHCCTETSLHVDSLLKRLYSNPLIITTETHLSFGLESRCKNTVFNTHFSGILSIISWASLNCNWWSGAVF